MATGLVNLDSHSHLIKCISLPFVLPSELKVETCFLIQPSISISEPGARLLPQDPFSVWSSSLLHVKLIDFAEIIMRNRHSMIPRVSAVAFLFLSFFPGCILSAFVTLKSIEIYTAHEWIERKSAVCFQCSGEDKTSFPDVKKVNVSYTFKGEESWQPLTDLKTKKCKRCGIYEDLLVSHIVFDEWELCSSDFTAPDGYYTHFKEKEFNATFLCKDCLSLNSDHPSMKVASESDGGKTTHILLIFMITVVIVIVVMIVSVLVYKCCQRRKRQQQHAKFLKLFEEEDDDMEDELGVKQML